MSRSLTRFILIVLAAWMILWALPAGAADLYRGQTIYVPAYSHIYHGPKATAFDLVCTLSVRNTDMNSTIEIVSVNYFNSKGDLAKRFLEGSEELKPLATKEFIIEKDDSLGGSGANFIVVWRAKEDVNPPLVEAVMIGTQSNQGISFTSRGKPIYVP